MSATGFKIAHNLGDVSLDPLRILYTTSLKFFKLTPNAKAPRKEHDGDAGWDLFYCGATPFKILPESTKVVPTGIALCVDQPFVAIIKEKSGLSTMGISVHAGVIDSGYRGEVCVVIHNRNQRGYREYTIDPGQKIAQVILVPVVMSKEVIELDELPDTARGDNGFGSTGLV